VFHRDAFTVVAPPIKIDQWDLAPFAWPPSELDHHHRQKPATPSPSDGPPLSLARDGA
jgi:hypothetical protein